MAPASDAIVQARPFHLRTTRRHILPTPSNHERFLESRGRPRQRRFLDTPCEMLVQACSRDHTELEIEGSRLASVAHGMAGPYSAEEIAQLVGSLATGLLRAHD